MTSFLKRIFGRGPEAVEAPRVNSAGPPRKPVRDSLLVVAYQNGADLSEVAEQFDIGEAYARAILKRNNVLMRREHKTPSERPRSARDQQICDLYESGVNTTQLDVMFGLTRERICQILRRANLIELRAERRRIARDEIARKENELRAVTAANLQERLDRGLALIREGRSARQAAMAIDGRPHSSFVAQLNKARKAAGIRITTSKWADFSDREQKVRELANLGYSTAEIVQRLRAAGDRVNPSWIGQKMPDVMHLIAQKRAERKTEHKRLSDDTEREAAANVIALRTTPPSLPRVPSARPERPLNFDPWTAENTELLVSKWMEGLSAQHIADILGEHFTRNMVIGKVNRLRNDGKLQTRAVDADRMQGAS